MTTPLDAAHAAMEASPGDEAARLAFHARLAEAELYLLLEAEPQGDTLAPRVFALEDGPVVLVFDTEERLGDFSGAAAPYAALPGGGLVRML
ncbi:SseB family protein, partial [Rhodobaculum claviforme]